MKALAVKGTQIVAESHAAGAVVSVGVGSVTLAAYAETWSPVVALVAMLCAIAVAVITGYVKLREERRNTIEFNEKHQGVNP